MQALEVVLTKRKIKTIFNGVIIVAIVAGLFVIVPILIKEFNFFMFLISLVFAGGGYFMMEDFFITYKYESIKLVIENSSPGKIKFYCLGNNTKVWHETQELKVANIK